MSNRIKVVLSMTVATLLGLGLLWSCAGSGVAWTEVEQPIKDSCISCHDAAKNEQLLKDITALDDKLFTAANYPDSNFPAGLIKKTVADMIKAADPPQDAKLDPKMALRKAWILHEMHELAELLKESTPPDYTSEKKFVAFATLKEQDSYEGCEIGDKLDKGHDNDPEGMPPLWTETLLKELKRDHKKLTPQQRQDLKDYVNGLLPGGLKACTGGQGSAS